MKQPDEEAPEGEPYEEKILREMLAGWGASEEQIRGIIEGLDLRGRKALPSPAGPTENE